MFNAAKLLVQFLPIAIFQLLAPGLFWLTFLVLATVWFTVVMVGRQKDRTQALAVGTHLFDVLMVGFWFSLMVYDFQRAFYLYGILAFAGAVSTQHPPLAEGR